MFLELGIAFSLGIIIIAFFAEYIDSTLGMGYGTTLTPLLLILGFAPLQIVPAILLSEFVTGLLAGFTHHSLGNVDFRPKTTKTKIIRKKLAELGYVESFKRGIPKHLKITMLIASCSIIGTIAAVLLAINLPDFYLKLYIGTLILAIGIFMLLTHNRNFGFSWKKITFLGLIASFNKGISGGGYGPVVTGGQILSGMNAKNAIGITSLAEGLTCIVGVSIYLILPVSIDWMLAPYLMVGALLSVPLSAYTVKKMKTDKLKIIICIITIILGTLTLAKLLL